MRQSERTIARRGVQPYAGFWRRREEQFEHAIANTVIAEMHRRNMAMFDRMYAANRKA